MFRSVDITTSVVANIYIDLLCPRIAFGKVNRTDKILSMRNNADSCNLMIFRK